MSKLRLTFYGDDFTGSTDALEQLTLAGIRAVLFLAPPTPAQLDGFPGLEAVGVAGLARSLAPGAMARELKPALLALKKLGAPHVHYKVCSTFDSSPAVGSIGRAVDLGALLFPNRFIPVLAAAPALGRYTVFGQHFARFGIGSAGAIYRLDRHPSISRHPVTPMAEADLCAHLARQTKKRIALFDILHFEPAHEARAHLRQLLAAHPNVVVFDALTAEHVVRLGPLLDEFAHVRQPLFSVGSSAIETALAALWRRKRPGPAVVQPARQILVGSGSCSPVTSGQMAWALKHGFVEVPLAAARLADSRAQAGEIGRAADAAAKHLRQNRNVIVHTTRRHPESRIAAQLKTRTAEVLGAALGRVLRQAVAESSVRRLCLAGGDTSSHAARALGIAALQIIAPLTPGAPLCRVHAPGSPAHGCEMVFKGGQVGAPDYFKTVWKGNA